MKRLFIKMNKKTDYSKTKIVDENAGYNPCSYLLSVVVIFIVKLLGINLYVGWYFAKIVNTIFFLIMGYCTVKKMPKFKMLTLLYLLLPMNLYQVTSISCDVMINVCGLYLVAHMLDVYVHKRKMKKFDFVLFTIFSFLIIISKMVYFPIVLLIIGLNIKNIMKDKKSILYLLLSIFILLLLFVLWQFNKTPQGNSFVQSEVISREVNSTYTILHPFSTIHVLVDYLLNCPDEYFMSFIGFCFIWSRVSVPMFYPAMYLVLMVLSTIVREDKEDYNLIVRFSFGIIAIVTSVLVIMALYVFDSNSNVLIGNIYGVQGRYFIPVFILFFFCIGKIKYKGNIEKFNCMLLAFALVIHVLYLIKFIGFII